jgi:hypothetical protein
MVKKTSLCLGFIALFSILIIPTIMINGDAQSIPSWIKNTALWYGEGNISETEFLNAIKFLIENEIIVIGVDPKPEPPKTINVIIPNGNSEVGNVGFYVPLNVQIPVGATVEWINEDAVPHTIQSQDANGNIISLFNSAPLYTGDRFTYTFDDSGIYNYYCTLHPWRVGLVTVT